MTKNVVGKSPRKTDHINRKQAQTLFRAVDFTIWNDAPLNYYVVLNIRESRQAGATTVFSKVRHKYRDWLTYKLKNGRLHGGRFAYIYVFENPDGMTHVNWLLRMDDDLRVEFTKKLRRWLERAQGSAGERDICVQTIEPGSEKCLTNYAMKGIDPAFAKHFYLEDIIAPQGPVWRQRAGASKNICKSARGKVGFSKPPRVYFDTKSGPRCRTVPRRIASEPAPDKLANGS